MSLSPGRRCHHKNTFPRVRVRCVLLNQTQGCTRVDARSHPASPPLRAGPQTHRPLLPPAAWPGSLLCPHGTGSRPVPCLPCPATAVRPRHSLTPAPHTVRVQKHRHTVLEHSPGPTARTEPGRLCWAWVYRIRISPSRLWLIRPTALKTGFLANATGFQGTSPQPQVPST